MARNHQSDSETTVAGSSEISTSADQMDGPLVSIPESDFIPESLDELVTLLGLEADSPTGRSADQCTAFAADELWPI